MKITPKDSIDALRLMRKHEDELLEPGDPTELKEQIQGIATTYLSQKREGKTDLDFMEWYEDADITGLDIGGDDGEAEADPTE